MHWYFNYLSTSAHSEQGRQKTVHAFEYGDILHRSVAEDPQRTPYISDLLIRHPISKAISNTRRNPFNQAVLAVLAPSINHIGAQVK